ncbi:MAG: hypothetical protein H6815_08785 [Phycisphaeraceae bacterium]|nr:hypothetical protein [Phycisphaerales bacterium]MCB9860538.1 hypothetical protein [Phycisphaeraceae bacterium]
MTVIRNPVAEQVVRDAIGLRLDDIARQAHALREAAEQQALETIEAAGRERERLISTAREEGYKRGFEQGQIDGLAQGKERGVIQAHEEASDNIAAMCHAWSQAVGRFEAACADAMTQARQDLVAFAVMLASRVVQRVVEHDPSTIENILDNALQHIVKATAVVIRTDTASGDVLYRASEDIASRLGHDTAVRIEVDESLPRGSCVIRTSAGTEVDASIGTQLDRLAEVIVPGLDLHADQTERVDG